MWWLCLRAFQTSAPFPEVYGMQIVRVYSLIVHGCRVACFKTPVVILLFRCTIYRYFFNCPKKVNSRVFPGRQYSVRVQPDYRITRRLLSNRIFAGNPLSGESDSHTNMALPTIWSSGTKPQNLESAELWRLSPTIQ